ncbi:hypothetical protein PAMP_016101 [Pampus punctatissimus]
MPLTVRNSALRRRKTPSEKILVMAPTRMKLRVRRRDNAAGGAAGGVQPEEERNRESGSRSSSRRKNTRNTSTAAAAVPSSSPPSSSASASTRAVLASEEASPDSKCPICLDRFNNLAYLDRCLHRFCFPCIQEWSHNKAECPLCKQPFASILHSVRAEDDFKEYTLRPAPANSSVAATVAMVAAMASAARSDHQMRLMLRRHRAADGGETTVRRRRRERGGRGGGGRRAGERTGVWEWYLDSPPLSLPPLPHHPAVSPVVADDSEEGEDLSQQRVRGGVGLAERGVIFEGLTGLTGAVAPVAPNDRASRRLMTSLVRRQRLQREGGTVRRMRERETVAFRRGLYRNGIRVRGVAGVNGNQGQRDITAESFRRTPTHLNRLRPWLRRELTVLYGAHGSLVDIVQRIIMARLARHGLEDMPTIEEELRPFLLARTDHFLHELVSFARSPLSLENYDLQAWYEPPATAMDLDRVSSSSDSSSVIAISEGEEEEEEGRVDAAVDDHIQTRSCLSLSAWDDETPGPSYSTAEPSCSLASLSFSPAPQETANKEGGEKREEEGEEECLIVGYKKPIAERTPELVQLSSDTEEEEKKEKEEDTVEKPLPLSCLRTIPPSTSGAYREEEKDVEVGGRCSRAHSWSGSGQDSVCTLSPATPRGSERRQERESWRDRKQPGSEEKRRRKKRRRDREQSRDWLRKSGTLYNPNRSIYPAMMRHHSHSPSPFHSSMESGSPLPPSPPDSSWEYCCSQISPLTSSVSSPSRSSSSPLCSSPQPSSPLPQTPPTPSLSPSDRSNPHRGEKPGGKRKYKSRHLDSDDKDPSWRPSGSHRRVRRREQGEKESRRRGRDGGRRRERTRRDAHRENAGCSGESRRCREERSPSVEIIYEGTVTSDATQPPTRKRRRKRHRKTQQSSSPVVIITLDSNSSHDDANNKINSSSCSSPLSSQQTVDFSDLPPLPLVPSTGVGPTMDAEIGELPVNILDRGSDGSEIEPVGQSQAADHIASDNSDQDVDVENVEESGSLMRCTGDDDKRANMHGPIRNADTKTTTGSQAAGVIKATPALVDGANDSCLLATVLSNLEGIAPKCELSSDSEPKCSSDTRKQSLVIQCEGRQAETTRYNPGFHEERRCSNGASFPLPPPLQRLKECRVREEDRDVPPLLKQASPVQSNNRNTPPPLKHKDAGSPRLSPVSAVDLHPPDTGVNPTVSHVDSAKDKQAVPPISTLKKHFTSTLALRREIASTSSTAAIDMHSSCHLATVDSRSAAPSDVGASTVDIHSMSHKSPIDSHSSFSGSNADRLPHLDFNRFPSSRLHSSHDSTKVAPLSFHKSSPTQLHLVNSLSAIDFHSAKERPAHINSTSSGHRNKPVWIAPIDLNPSSSVFAEGAPTGSDVFSGADASLPVCVSSIDSYSYSNAANREKLSERLSPSRVSSGPSTTPSGRLVDVHPRSPKSPVDLHSSSAASEGLTDIKASSVVSHEDQSPLVDLHVRSPVPPVNLHSSSFVRTTIEGHLNHTALSSLPTENSWTKCSSESEPTVESHSEPPHTTDSDPKPHNHFDPGSDACSERRVPVDSHSKHSRRDFRHITSSPESVENQWDSSIDQRSANTVWNTHTRLK